MKMRWIGGLTMAGLACCVVAAFSQPPEPVRRSDRKENTAAQQGGIQWFSTWKSGLREAQRSGRPILLLAAPPHCAGVPGTW